MIRRVALALTTLSSQTLTGETHSDLDHPAARRLVPHAGLLAAVPGNRVVAGCVGRFGDPGHPAPGISERVGRPPRARGRAPGLLPDGRNHALEQSRDLRLAERVWHEGTKLLVTSVNCYGTDDRIFAWPASGSGTSGDSYEGGPTDGWHRIGNTVLETNANILSTNYQATASSATSQPADRPGLAPGPVPGGAVFTQAGFTRSDHPT